MKDRLKHYTQLSRAVSVCLSLLLCFFSVPLPYVHADHIPGHLAEDPNATGNPETTDTTNTGNPDDPLPDTFNDFMNDGPLAAATEADYISVPGQDEDVDQYDVFDNGETIDMWGNNMKALQGNYTITENTILEFEFLSYGEEAEINGILFDTNLDITRSEDGQHMFQIFGTQNWGIRTQPQYIDNGTYQTFKIKVGDYFTGDFSYLTLFNDADNGQATDITYTNIRLYEDTPVIPPAPADPYISVLGQDQDPDQYEVTDNDSTLHMWGNNMKALPGDYEITKDTVIEFEFKSTGEQAEINGILFDHDTLVGYTDDHSKLLQIFGTQDWDGHVISPQYSGSGEWETFKIRVGDYYTGFFDYLTFLNDADGGQDTDVFYRNFRMFEEALPPAIVDPYISIPVQDKDPEQYEFSEAENMIHMWGNNAKGIRGDFHITADTIIQFEFKSEGEQAEINGILFDINTNINRPDDGLQTLQIFGTQNWGHRISPQYSGSGEWETFRIRVGDYFTGDFNYLTLFNDADQGQDTSVFYRNIELSNEPRVPEADPYISVPEQDLNPTQYEVIDNDSTLHMWGNNMKSLPGDYQITENTILEFDFKSTGEKPEINGILFDTNTHVYRPDDGNQMLQVFGSQNWGHRVSPQYSGNGDWQTFQIRVSDYFMGDFNYLTFFNDADKGQATDVFYRNLRIFEDTTLPPPPPESQYISVPGQDEDVNQYNVTDNGITLNLWGNNMKALEGDYKITEDTVLEFDFFSNGEEAEINGILFDTNLDIDYDDDHLQAFQIYGTQNWGRKIGAQYSGDGGWESFRIRVGDFFTGDFNYLTIFNDADHDQDTNVSYRNIRVFEDPRTPGTDPFISIPIQDVHSDQYEVTDNDSTLRMWGNNMKGIQGDYEITEDTILEFDFKSEGENAEINGILFDTDTYINRSDDGNQMLQVFGTQNWGHRVLPQYAGNGEWQTFKIRVGDFFTGNFSYLTFFNDADAGQNTNVSYRNWQIYEDSSGPIMGSGGIFEQNDYGLDTQRRLASVDSDSSGLTINPNGFPPIAPTLLTVDDQGTIHELAMDGTYLRSVSLTGFTDIQGVTDIEGITHVAGNTFALITEREPRLILVNIDASTTSINMNAGNVLVYSLSDDYYADNRGLEGITYAGGAFYIAREGSGGKMIYKVELSGLSATVTPNPFPTRSADLPISGINGLHALGNSLFILGRDSKKVLEMDMTSGKIISSFSFPAEITGKIEGIHMDADGTLYLIAESGSTAGSDFYILRPDGIVRPPRTPVDTTAYPPPPPHAEALNLTGKVAPVAVEDVDSDHYQLVSSGYGIRMFGNSWKRINLDLDVTEDTILQFEFINNAIDEAEINGIALDDGDLSGESPVTFQIFGTEYWATNHSYPYTDNGDWQTIRIPLGKFDQAFYSSFFLINDADGNQNTNVEYRNFIFYEPLEDFRFNFLDRDSEGLLNGQMTKSEAEARLARAESYVNQGWPNALYDNNEDGFIDEYDYDFNLDNNIDENDITFLETFIQTLGLTDPPIQVPDFSFNFLDRDGSGNLDGEFTESQAQIRVQMLLDYVANGSPLPTFDENGDGSINELDYDINRDGTVGNDDALPLIVLIENESLPDPLPDDFSFDYLDRDETGQLDRKFRESEAQAKIQNILDYIGNGTPLPTFDENGDGFINALDYDINHDGTVDHQDVLILIPIMESRALPNIPTVEEATFNLLDRDDDGVLDGKFNTSEASRVMQIVNSYIANGFPQPVHDNNYDGLVNGLDFDVNFDGVVDENDVALLEAEIEASAQPNPEQMAFIFLDRNDETGELDDTFYRSEGFARLQRVDDYLANGAPLPRFDNNRDGVVDLFDYDITQDGIIDEDDRLRIFSVLNQRGKQDPPPPIEEFTFDFLDRDEAGNLDGQFTFSEAEARMQLIVGYLNTGEPLPNFDNNSDGKIDILDYDIDRDGEVAGNDILILANMMRAEALPDPIEDFSFDFLDRDETGNLDGQFTVSEGEARVNKIVDYLNDNTRLPSFDNNGDGSINFLDYDIDRDGQITGSDIITLSNMIRDLALPDPVVDFTFDFLDRDTEGNRDGKFTLSEARARVQRIIDYLNSGAPLPSFDHNQDGEINELDYDVDHSGNVDSTDVLIFNNLINERALPDPPTSEEMIFNFLDRNVRGEFDESFSASEADKQLSKVRDFVNTGFPPPAHDNNFDGVINELDYDFDYSGDVNSTDVLLLTNEKNRSEVADVPVTLDLVDIRNTVNGAVVTFDVAGLRLFPSTYVVSYTGASSNGSTSILVNENGRHSITVTGLPSNSSYTCSLLGPNDRPIDWDAYTTIDNLRFDTLGTTPVFNFLDINPQTLELDGKVTELEAYRNLQVLKNYINVFRNGGDVHDYKIRYDFNNDGFDFNHFNYDFNDDLSVDGLDIQIIEDAIINGGFTQSGPSVTLSVSSVVAQQTYADIELTVQSPTLPLTYQVNYRKADGSIETMPFIVTSNNTQMLRLSGLEPGAEYFFNIEGPFEVPTNHPLYTVFPESNFNTTRFAAIEVTNSEILYKDGEPDSLAIIANVDFQEPSAKFRLTLTGINFGISPIVEEFELNSPGEGLVLRVPYNRLPGGRQFEFELVQLDGNDLVLTGTAVTGITITTPERPPIDQPPPEPEVSPYILWVETEKTYKSTHVTVQVFGYPPPNWIMVKHNGTNQDGMVRVSDDGLFHFDINYAPWFSMDNFRDISYTISATNLALASDPRIPDSIKTVEASGTIVPPLAISHSLLSWRPVGVNTTSTQAQFSAHPDVRAHDEGDGVDPTRYFLEYWSEPQWRVPDNPLEPVGGTVWSDNVDFVLQNLRPDTVYRWRIGVYQREELYYLNAREDLGGYKEGTFQTAPANAPSIHINSADWEFTPKIEQDPDDPIIARGADVTLHHSSIDLSGWGNIARNISIAVRYETVDGESGSLAITDAGTFFTQGATTSTFSTWFPNHFGSFNYTILIFVNTGGSSDWSSYLASTTLATFTGTVFLPE